MMLSSWSEKELVSLARVYIKHRQFERSQSLREELRRRIETANTDHLKILLEQLNQLEGQRFAQRLLKMFGHAA